MKMRITAALLALLWLTGAHPASGVCFHGQNDAGPIGLEVKLTESGDTLRRQTMFGFSDSATILLENGICFKPSLLVASGDGGSLLNTGLGVGYLIPIWKGFYLTPQVAITYGTLDTHVPFLGETVSEEMRSWTPSLGFDVSYMITPCWGISGSYLYGWSSTRTALGPYPKDKSESTGGNYRLQVDYYFKKWLSLNATFAYNSSMSKEKHGLTAVGGRIGFGVCF